MTGKRIKQLEYILLALMFSMGSLSVGYGFWTDRLDLEGEAEVRFSVDIIDDIIDQPVSVSPQALQLIEEPINNIESSGGKALTDSSTPLLPETLEPEPVEPEIVEPETEIVEPEPEKPEIVETETIKPVTVEPETEKPAADDTVVQTPE